MTHFWREKKYGDIGDVTFDQHLDRLFPFLSTLLGGGAPVRLQCFPVREQYVVDIMVAMPMFDSAY